MGKFGFNPAKFIHWSDSPRANYSDQFHTEYKKRVTATPGPPFEKFCTAPHTPPKNCSALDSRASQASQHDYMKRHLYVKSCVDKEKSEWRFQAQKVSIRNYTPKVINQEMNMGMWM